VEAQPVEVKVLPNDNDPYLSSLSLQGPLRTIPFLDCHTNIFEQISIRKSRPSIQTLWLRFPSEKKLGTCSHLLKRKPFTNLKRKPFFRIRVASIEKGVKNPRDLNGVE
jgi:hypothetical protein